MRNLPVIRHFMVHFGQFSVAQESALTAAFAADEATGGMREGVCTEGRCGRAAAAAIDEPGVAAPGLVTVGRLGNAGAAGEDVTVGTDGTVEPIELL